MRREVARYDTDFTKLFKKFKKKKKKSPQYVFFQKLIRSRQPFDDRLMTWHAHYQHAVPASGEKASNARETVGRPTEAPQKGVVLPSPLPTQPSQRASGSIRTTTPWSLVFLVFAFFLVFISRCPRPQEMTQDGARERKRLLLPWMQGARRVEEAGEGRWGGERRGHSGTRDGAGCSGCRASISMVRAERARESTLQASPNDRAQGQLSLRPPLFILVFLHRSLGSV